MTHGGLFWFCAEKKPQKNEHYLPVLKNCARFSILKCILHLFPWQSYRHFFLQSLPGHLREKESSNQLRFLSRWLGLDWHLSFPEGQSKWHIPFFFFLKSHSPSSVVFHALILCLVYLPDKYVNLKVKCIISIPRWECLYLCLYGVKKNMPSWLAPDDPSMICSEKRWRACATLTSYKMINIFILRSKEENCSWTTTAYGTAIWNYGYTMESLRIY